MIAVDCHDTRIAQPDFALGIARILEFDDCLQPAIGSGDKAAVFRRIFRPEAENDHRRVICRAARYQHVLHGFRRQKRRIAEQHQHIAGEIRHLLAGGEHGMSRAERLCLHGGIGRCDGFDQLGHAGSDHDHGAFRRNRR